MTPERKKLYIDLCSDLTACLTLASLIPYELGDASILLPPKVKATCVIVGIVATVALRIVGRFVTYLKNTADK